MDLPVVLSLSLSNSQPSSDETTPTHIAGHPVMNDYGEDGMFTLDDALPHLRTPRAHERTCVNGPNCKVMRVPFADVYAKPLVEYQTPAMQDEYRNTREWPGRRGECLLCRGRPILVPINSIYPIQTGDGAVYYRIV